MWHFQYIISKYILSWFITVGCDFHYLAEVFIRLIHCKVPNEFYNFWEWGNFGMAFSLWENPMAWVLGTYLQSDCEFASNSSPGGQFLCYFLVFGILRHIGSVDLSTKHKEVSGSRYQLFRSLPHSFLEPVGNFFQIHTSVEIITIWWTWL